MNNIRKLVREIIRESMVSEREVSAYHGSPHEFDKFTTAKIGTGEGVQAFGWGLYFTDLEDIAKKYAEELGNVEARIYINGKELAYGHPLFDYKNFILRADGNTESILKELKEIQELEKDFPKNARTMAREKAIAFLEKNPKIKIDAPKVIYKVKLHKGKTPNQYDWLNWYEPVSKNQILKIKKQIKREKGSNRYGRISIEGDVIYKEWGSKEEVKSGRDLYRALAGDSSEKEASLFLLRAGIDGIKYPAESIARGATSDTARGYNYVVFDENAVSIEKVDKI